MKLKFALLIFIAGFFLTLFGLLFKLESWELATEMLVAGLLAQMVGVVFIVLNAMKSRRQNL